MIGPCAKSQVYAVLMMNGDTVLGTNSCLNPQTECPRVEGEDYTKCKTICSQISHAEADAVRQALDKYGSAQGHLMLFGHSRICYACARLLQDHHISLEIMGHLEKRI